MRSMFGARETWVRFSKQLRFVQNRPFCTDKNVSKSIDKNRRANGFRSTYDDAYRQLGKLDFITAAKILFTTPPKTKKFGLDFHLVQLFFVCMPSLAVYLVAQYARYEMRRMEAELEQKKQAEEEAKAKELELNASEETEADSNPELLKLKVRLDNLEEAVKEIVVESKKQSALNISKNQEDSSKKDNLAVSGIKAQSILEESPAAKDLNKQTSENVTSGSGQDKVSGSAPLNDAS